MARIFIAKLIVLLRIRHVLFVSADRSLPIYDDNWLSVSYSGAKYTVHSEQKCKHAL